jgi:hypothetical protein
LEPIQCLEVDITSAADADLTRIKFELEGLPTEDPALEAEAAAAAAAERGLKPTTDNAQVNTSPLIDDVQNLNFSATNRNHINTDTPSNQTRLIQFTR